MRKLILLLITSILIIATSCSEKELKDFVFVKGGTLKNIKSNNIKVSGFFIGKYEVTQKEWIEVMGNNPSQFVGDNLPVETVSWYDCVEYCNKRSIKEGLKPFYNIEKNKKDQENNNELDDIKWTVTIKADANGYRLPTESEWEFAAIGGQKSKGYTYCGSNDIDKVAWYWRNSGDKPLTGEWLWPTLEENHCKTKTVGSKKANELGIYDMSGNVREWCWDWFESNVPEEPKGRVWRGGGWIGADFCCEPIFRVGHQANGKGPDQGLRICRSK